MAPREQRVLTTGFSLLGGNSERLREALTSPVAKTIQRNSAKSEALKKKEQRLAIAERTAKIEEREAQKEAEQKPELTFVDLEVLDGDGKPVEGVRYRVSDPFGHVKEGTTDAQGKAHVEGFVKGFVTISLPEIDGDEWWSEELGNPKIVAAERARAAADDFLELELLDEDGQPLAGEAYEVEDLNGTLFEGTLDDKGFARIEKVAKGSARVRFPALDGNEWRPA